MKRIAALALFAALTGPVAADIADRSAVQEFIDRMSREHGFERGRLEAVFRDVEIQQDIIEAISRPAESLPWHRYRPIFVTESRTREGVAFWQANAELLAEAEERYGVDPAVVVAILGVETRYGAHKGGHRVVDALSTLAFAYPPRADFFRSELEHYLLMAREEGFAPAERLGSYAGAMGKPQFIASSFRRFAVDFDGDGRRDLWQGTADAIGSVAHYLKVHDWQRGGAIATPAPQVPDDASQLAERGYKPWASVAHLRARGVNSAADVPDDAEAALLELEGADGPRYWVVLNNFYAITRYNHSPLYAMAVHQLAEAIRAARQGGSAAE